MVTSTVLAPSAAPWRGDLLYVSSTDGGATFSPPIRVNSRPDTAIAAGTIRGGKMALGSGGRVHVLWNGASDSEPRGVLDPDRPADDPHNGTRMLRPARRREDRVRAPAQPDAADLRAGRGPFDRRRWCGQSLVDSVEALHQE